MIDERPYSKMDLNELLDAAYGEAWAAKEFIDKQHCLRLIHVAFAIRARMEQFETERDVDNFMRRLVNSEGGDIHEGNG